MVFNPLPNTIFDGVRERLRKVASSAFLYKKLLSARWWHIPNPLEQANRLATQFLRIAIFAVGNFFRNEKRGEPISLKLTDSPLELSSDIVFSDTFLLLLLFITFKELVDIIFCSLNLLHIFLNLTIFTVQLFLFCKDLGILCTEIFYLRKLLQIKLIKGILGSLMKQDFLSVLFQELLAISAFTIIRIYIFGLEVTWLIVASSCSKPFADK